MTGVALDLVTVGFTVDSDLRIYHRRAAAGALVLSGCDIHHEALAENPGR